MIRVVSQPPSFADISKAAEDFDKRDAENEIEKEAAAATKIQAAFRGHYARKSLRPSKREADDEKSASELQEEFPSESQGERVYMYLG